MQLKLRVGTSSDVLGEPQSKKITVMLCVLKAFSECHTHEVRGGVAPLHGEDAFIAEN